MHSNIIFLTDENGRKSDFDINGLENQIYPCDIGMESVAEYIGGVIELPEHIGNISVNQKDNSIELTKINIEEYFSKQYKKFVEKYSKLTLTNFCSVDAFDFQQTIDEAFDVYVVCVYADGSYENAETLDSFFRRVYRFSLDDDCPKQTYYILGCMDYKF